MKSLGYPMTWVTDCFINGGCGATVYAHTSGHGDFVLFDELGWPWAVHDCYINRFCNRPAARQPDRQSEQLSYSLDALIELVRKSNEYRNVAERAPTFQAPATSPRDIKRVEPAQRPAGRTFTVRGYIAEIQSRQRPKALSSMGGLGERIAEKVIGDRHSQVTIITGDFESFTVLADIRQVVVAKGDVVAVDLRSTSVLTYTFFVCDRLERLSINVVATRRRSK